MDNKHFEISASASERCIYNCYSCLFVKCVLVKEFMNFSIPQSVCDYMNVEHLIPYESSWNVVLRVSMSMKADRSRHHRVFIVKMPKSENIEKIKLPEMASFKNEVLFYSKILPKFNQLCPECYDVDNSLSSLQQPILVLQDLTAFGYTQFKDKLNEDDLVTCVRLLAWFHAMAFRLQIENPELFRNVYEELFHMKKYQEEIMKMKNEKLRAFLNGSIMTSLDSHLREKIKRKLQMICQGRTLIPVWTIIHGSFTRSKVFIKYENNEKHVKLIDFEALQFSSISVDFGRIFLTNLPNENDVLKLETLFRIMMQNYLSKLNEKCPQVMSWFVGRDIINHMIFSYINLDDKENEAIENHIPILHMFNNIGCFD